MSKKPKFVIFAHNATYDKLHQVATLGMTAAAMGKDVIIVLLFWTIKKLADGSYEGTAGDILGIATGQAEGSAVNWHYVMDLPVDDTTYRIRFDDWMWVMNDGVMINRSYLKKFGVTVSELTIFMKKQK